MRRLALGLFLALYASLAPAAETGAMESMRRFFNEVKSYSAGFQQTVVDEAGKPLDEASGRFWLQRPDKFRWNYEKPFKQQIVGDGEKIWIYDEELKQITVRDMSKTLLDTPAALLAGRGRPEDQFTVKPLGERDELSWVQLIPKRKESGFEEIRLGFAEGKFRALEMVDGLGQTTRYQFSNAQENANIEPARFTFTPPPGIDVVGEP